MFNNIKFSIKLTIIAFKIINNRNLFINKDTVIPCRFLRFFCFIIPSKKNNNISKFAQDLGVIFIKLGQTLSTRHDILGKEIANKFSNLQDQVSPFSGDIAIQIIEDSLNIKIKNTFKEFNSKAIASASISQVHFAVDKNDTKIAIKVLRPNIAVQIKKEIKMLYWIAGFLSKFSYFDRIKPNEIVKEIESSLIQEIDLRFEASAASEMKENSLNDKDLYIPKIFWNYVTEKTLAMEAIEGIKITDIDCINKNKINVNTISQNLINVFFNQAYRDGFFHADMHPGNIFIDNNCKIMLVDFGITARLSYKDRIAVFQILSGFINKDYYKIARIHKEVGYIPQDANIGLFAQACRSIGESVVDLPINQISISNLLEQLFRITEIFAMQTQPQLLLLQKNMLLIEGVIYSLNQEANIWELSKPWIDNCQFNTVNHMIHNYYNKFIDAQNNISNFIESNNKLLKNIEQSLTQKKKSYNFSIITFLLIVIIFLLVLLTN